MLQVLGGVGLQLPSLLRHPWYIRPRLAGLDFLQICIAAPVTARAGFGVPKTWTPFPSCNGLGSAMGCRTAEVCTWHRDIGCPEEFEDYLY